MDRWFRAAVQSCTGQVHRSLAFMMAKYNTFLTESGLGNAPGASSPCRAPTISFNSSSSTISSVGRIAP